MPINYRKYITEYFSKVSPTLTKCQEIFWNILRDQLLYLAELPTNSNLSPIQYVEKLNIWQAPPNSKIHKKYLSFLTSWCNYNLGDATIATTISTPVFNISRILHNMSNCYERAQIIGDLSENERNRFSKSMMKISQDHMRKIAKDWSENGEELAIKYRSIPVSIFKKQKNESDFNDEIKKKVSFDLPPS